MYAMAQAPMHVIERIIALGSDFSLHTNHRSGRGPGMRAIHWAITAKRKEAVELLLRSGDYLEESLPNGQPLLDYVVEHVGQGMDEYVSEVLTRTPK